ncbi:MAG: DAG-kinase catalytic domain protein [Myxococcales bacterium]|nr:DAG-kinase catalytic domain protein [Myxococcales bacterium]
MTRLAVVLNPHALGVRRAPGLADRLRAVLGDGGDIVVTRTPADLAVAARRFAAEGVELVAACGGDGTLLSTVSELVQAYGADRLPTFAILRGGTVNTIARNLDIRGRPEEILARLVARARAGQVPAVGQDLLAVNGLYGFLFASLMGARFLEAYYGGFRPGPTWAAMLTARTVVSSFIQGKLARWLFSPVDMELTVDGERVPPQPYRLLVASVVKDVGLGFKVPWQAGTEEGRFHLVASGLSTTAMALQLHRVFAGRPLVGAPHLDRLATRVHIRFMQPQTYTLDGDLFRSTDVDLVTGPRLQIARP